MSIIPEVKCRRCGESFSALRSRCPSCGTRRVIQSTRTPDTTPSTNKDTAAYERTAVNTRWQMIFGLILVVAVILAVIVMVSTGLNDNSGSTPSRTKTTPTPPVASTEVPPTVEAAPTPTPTPTPAVQTLEIRRGYDDVKLTEFTMSVGEQVGLSAAVLPATITGNVTWRITDEDARSCFKITVNPDNGNKCTIECLAGYSGGTSLDIELYGQHYSCKIYTRG